MERLENDMLFPFHFGLIFAPGSPQQPPPGARSVKDPEFPAGIEGLAKSGQGQLFRIRFTRILVHQILPGRFDKPGSPFEFLVRW